MGQPGSSQEPDHISPSKTEFTTLRTVKRQTEQLDVKEIETGRRNPRLKIQRKRLRLLRLGAPRMAPWSGNSDF